MTGEQMENPSILQVEDDRVSEDVSFNMKEMVGGCCVCSDERGWPDNPLVYCDGNGCTVAVHQACYGIVTVPTGPWYCRKCESPENKGKVRCELCPSKSGALKRSDTGGWAHVVCALYIPEVRFGNVTSMEPIVLRLIPPERYNKTCYICQESSKSHRASAGACMQCNKSGCKQQFHVTCAQSLGLLCEEAGNYLDNVKYCGYCQHHYSKLLVCNEAEAVRLSRGRMKHHLTLPPPPLPPLQQKKGGNVKTIPPYKPVTHDSHSSDSSGEKDGDASPKGGATPTHGKSKGSVRKSSHSTTSVSGKSTPNPAKTPTSASQPLAEPAAEPAVTQAPTTSSRKHKSSDKHKSRKSPSRRSSSTGEPSGSGSKSNTPAPSPQHSADSHPAQAKAGGSTPGARASPPAPAKPEPAGVINAAPAPVAAITTAPSSAPLNPPPAVQPGKAQESVITNTEAAETKSKKRKAVAAGAPIDYAAPAVNEQPANMWEAAHAPQDVTMDSVDKLVKKAKTEVSEPPAHYGPGGPAPPPAHSPSGQPNPRSNPMPGPSGMGQPSNIRSPSQPQSKPQRETASLLVSVPLPPTSYGLNLSSHAQMSAPPAENVASAHAFHQAQKQVVMDQSVPTHSPHSVPGRATWGGLNVSYEMQDPSKSSVPSKDPNAVGQVRNKKRAAMATSVVSMANSNIQAPAPPMMSNVRRPPQATPPPLYQETVKDSPPGSPGSEKPLKPKIENSSLPGAAPHMLGNELNPESGAAARLQQQLAAELAVHAAGAGVPSHLVPPPLINKASQGAPRGSSTGAQSLDQLLERQWEQGSQFLMEQAQHFDIASLLSCLHQLRTENVRLEEHVGSLLQRRDHLLAVNARLAIPLTAVSSGPPEPARCPRENGSQMRPPSAVRAETVTGDRSHQMMVREVQQKPS